MKHRLSPLFLLLAALLLGSCSSLRNQVYYWCAPAPEPYTVKRVNPARKPSFDFSWFSPAWDHAETLKIRHFLAKSTLERPTVSLKLLHDGEYLYGLAYAADQYVLTVFQRPNEMVCRDTCVEVFLMPSGKGYSNFEMGLAGGVLAQWRSLAADGRQSVEMIPGELLAKTVLTKCSLPQPVNPECEQKVVWFLEFRIPLALLDRFRAKKGSPSGESWTGNFYYCTSHSSHPRWASWAPVSAFDFHVPREFQPVLFE